MDMSEKYRPVRFEELWQWPSPALQAVTNEIARGFLQTPFLLLSDYGLGKTTTARIIGRRASCLNASAHLYEPCNQCEGCRRMDEVRHASTIWSEYGYIEIDCTEFSPTEIRHTIARETHGRLFRTSFRQWVVCLDEVGRREPNFQRQLLKLVENSRAHIILCASIQDEVDKALRERCAIRPLTAPSLEQCLQALLRIAQAEEFALPEMAATRLVSHLGCNPRRILKCLNTALALGQGTIGLKEIETALKMMTE